MKRRRTAPEHPPESLNPDLLDAAVYSNSFKTIEPWIESTGLRTNQARQKTTIPNDGIRVAQEFLINSRLSRHDRENELSIRNYLMDSGLTMLSMHSLLEQEVAEIPLESSHILKMQLSEALSRRRSHRQFTGDSITLKMLSSLIEASVGTTKILQTELTDGTETTLSLRSYPSAGGLYPIDIYVVSCNIEGLEKGIFKYSVKTNSLRYLTGAETVERFVKCFAVPEEFISISRANLAILLVCQPWRTMRKYGTRGMRFVLMEAGAISQNFHLAATALGLGSLDCASIYDNEVHELLDLDGLHKALLHTLIIGVKA